METDFPLPADFHLRVKAARGYMGDISQETLAVHLGMSEGYVRNLEKAKSTKGLERRGLVARLSEVSGLPEGFFLNQETAVEQRLAAIDEGVRLLQAQLAAHDAEARRQIAAALRATLDGVQRRQPA